MNAKKVIRPWQGTTLGVLGSISLAIEIILLFLLLVLILTGASIGLIDALPEEASTIITFISRFGLILYPPGSASLLDYSINFSG